MTDDGDAEIAALKAPLEAAENVQPQASCRPPAAAALLAGAISLLVVSSAQAMPLAAKERLDQVGRWIPYSAACTRVGFEVSPTLGDEATGAALSEKVVQQAVALGAAPEEAQSEFVAAIRRNGNLFRAELDDVLQKTKDAKAMRPAVSGFFRQVDAECSRLAADAIFQPFVSAPPAAVRTAARVATEDSLLELNGEASWQTPKSQALGDLYFAVGTCRRHLSASDLERYRAAIEASQPDARRVYERFYGDGIDSAAEMNFTPAQCVRAIAAIQARLK